MSLNDSFPKQSEQAIDLVVKVRNMTAYLPEENREDARIALTGVERYINSTNSQSTLMQYLNRLQESIDAEDPTSAAILELVRELKTALDAHVTSLGQPQGSALERILSMPVATIRGVQITFASVLAVVLLLAGLTFAGVNVGALI